MSRSWRNAPARLLVLDKPAGPTSFELVRRVRRWSGYRRVGHAGTLDPFASGVLVLGLGSATRLLGYLAAGDKSYRLRVEFGRATDSHDATGICTAEAEPDFTRAQLESHLPRFVGKIQQIPPTLSAIHVDGKRAYKLHREGNAPENMPAREVHIHELELLEFDLPHAEFLVRCGGGAYMRALARDLGLAVDCPAHAATLRRESVGPFDLAMALPREGLEERCTEEKVGLDPADLVRSWRRIDLDDDELVAIRHGVQPPDAWLQRASEGAVDRPLALLDRHGQLAAIAEASGGSCRLAVVLPPVDNG